MLSLIFLFPNDTCQLLIYRVVSIASRIVCHDIIYIDSIITVVPIDKSVHINIIYNLCTVCTAFNSPCFIIRFEIALNPNSYCTVLFMF